MLTANEKRAQIGREALKANRDYLAIERGHTDLETVAADTIADILHAVFGVWKEPNPYLEAEALVERALRAWEGDAEDEEPVSRTILVHLNVAVPASDASTAYEVSLAVEEALDGGLDRHFVDPVTAVVVLAEEVD